MGQIVELQPHAVLEIFLEHHAANAFGHGFLPVFMRLADVPLAAGDCVQAAAEFMRFSNACLVAIKRSAINAWRF
jgi:hypothetical protein